MNIQTVAENLRNTIAGKEKHQIELEYALTLATTGERMALVSVLNHLALNIDELTRILQDVEQCVLEYDDLKSDLKEANGRVRQLERENSDMSWEINPDRMGL
jgi:uncharacterized membrane protein